MYDFSNGGRIVTSSKWDDPELPKALDRSNKADYVRTHVKEPLEEIVNPLFKGEKLLFTESIDHILLSIFTHIDLLGYLYKGGTSQSNAVEFLREYLGRIDPRYKEVGGLLYASQRHGLVHLATPKRIQLRNGMDFSYVGFGERQDHLKVTKRQAIERGKRFDIYELVLNLSLLYSDLLSAMDEYAKDVCVSQGLADVFWETFTARRTKEAKEAEIRRKPYVQDSDFVFIMEQISRL